MADDNGKTRATVAVLNQQLNDMKEQNARDNARIEKKIDDLIIAQGVRDERNETKYVTKTEFDPVKRLVFGVVTIILMAVAGAVVGLVVLPNQQPQVTQNAK